MYIYAGLWYHFICYTTIFIYVQRFWLMLCFFVLFWNTHVILMLNFFRTFYPMLQCEHFTRAAQKVHGKKIKEFCLHSISLNFNTYGPMLLQQIYHILVWCSKSPSSTAIVSSFDEKRFLLTICLTFRKMSSQRLN